MSGQRRNSTKALSEQFEGIAIVAETTTELMNFEPEVCICNGHSLGFKRESVSVMEDFLLTFPQICLCNDN